MGALCGTDEAPPTRMKTKRELESEGLYYDGVERRSKSALNSNNLPSQIGASKSRLKMLDSDSESEEAAGGTGENETPKVLMLVSQTGQFGDNIVIQRGKKKFEVKIKQGQTNKCFIALDVNNDQVLRQDK